MFKGVKGLIEHLLVFFYVRLIERVSYLGNQRNKKERVVTLRRTQEIKKAGEFLVGFNFFIFILF